MHPMIMVCWLLASSAGARPAALVCEADGKARLERAGQRPRTLDVLDVLLPGDQVHAGPGGVRLVFMQDDHRERVKANALVTVDKNGCNPASAVEREATRLTKSNARRVHSYLRSERGGVGVLRAVDDPPAVSPMLHSIVVTNMPAFRWPALRGALGYDVRLYSGEGPDERLEWKASTAGPEALLRYPVQSAKPLPWGTVRYWEVTARLKGDKEQEVIRRAEFSVATRGEAESLRELKTLTDSNDPANWLVAAVAYEAAGAYNDALGQYERVVQKCPEQPRLQTTLLHYYERAGLKDKAAAVRQHLRAIQAKRQPHGAHTTGSKSSPSR